MLSLKSISENSLKTLHDMHHLLQCILDNGTASTYSDIIKACVIFITLPVTVRNAERLFSELKI